MHQWDWSWILVVRRASRGLCTYTSLLIIPATGCSSTGDSSFVVASSGTKMSKKHESSIKVASYFMDRMYINEIMIMVINSASHFIAWFLTSSFAHCYQSIFIIFVFLYFCVCLQQVTEDCYLQICSFALWSWLRGTSVQRLSLAGDLSLSCARPVAEGWPLMWVIRPL